GLAAGLGGYLHRKARRRRARVRGGEEPKKAGPLRSFDLIGLRPEIAGMRTEVGHFEGDLIIGAGGRSAVVTLVEQMSRYSFLGELPDGHDA
ncbi:MAG: IS30 family transposase, partial [Acidimicrobiales bacterium]